MDFSKQEQLETAGWPRDQICPMHNDDEDKEPSTHLICLGLTAMTAAYFGGAVACFLVGNTGFGIGLVVAGGFSYCWYCLDAAFWAYRALPHLGRTLTAKNAQKELEGLRALAPTLAFKHQCYHEDVSTREVTDENGNTSTDTTVTPVVKHAGMCAFAFAHHEDVSELPEAAGRRHNKVLRLTVARHVELGDDATHADFCARAKALAEEHKGCDTNFKIEVEVSLGARPERRLLRALVLRERCTHPPLWLTRPAYVLSVAMLTAWLYRMAFERWTEARTYHVVKRVQVAAA